MFNLILERHSYRVSAQSSIGPRRDGNRTRNKSFFVCGACWPWLYTGIGTVYSVRFWGVIRYESQPSWQPDAGQRLSFVVPGSGRCRPSFFKIMAQAGSGPSHFGYLGNNHEKLVVILIPNDLKQLYCSTSAPLMKNKGVCLQLFSLTEQQFVPGQSHHLRWNLRRSV